MIKIGLTGNIGSGKTTVAHIFGCLNVPVFYADLAARDILNSEDIRLDLITTFGEDIIVGNEVNRPKLGSIVFQDVKELEKLNQLIHPRVRDAYFDWLEVHANEDYTIHEAAILFESGFSTYVDQVINVHADINVRIERIKKRDSLSESEISNRMSRQWSDQQKMELSNYTVINNGDQLVIPQVLDIHYKLKKVAK